MGGGISASFSFFLASAARRFCIRSALNSSDVGDDSDSTTWGCASVSASWDGDSTVDSASGVPTVLLVLLTTA